MKVYEIVSEADNVIPFPGKGPAPKNGANAFSQMANQLGGGASSTGGTTTQTATGSVHTSNPNNPNNPTKPSTTTAPASTDTTNKKQKPDVNELKKKLKPEHKSKVDKQVEQKTAEFFKKVSWVGRKLSIIIPVMSWIDEMATVNVLQQEGYIDGIQAQNFRAAYSGACFTEMVTNWAAFLAFAKTSSTILTGLRTVLLGIPGAGWIAWVVTALAQTALFAVLNTEAVQNYICKLIMTLAWPAADWVGSVGELGVINWADKVKDELRDAAKEPGAIGRNKKPAQQTTPSQPATGNQPASAPAAPSGGQAAQPSVTGADLMKSIGL